MVSRIVSTRRASPARTDAPSGRGHARRLVTYVDDENQNTIEFFAGICYNIPVIPVI